MTGRYDVIVVGGEPAGIGAALAAGRAGKRIVLVKQYGFLGGMWTAGLVPLRVDGLLVAGRCISGTCEAPASYRVTGNSIAIGQAAEGQLPCWRWSTGRGCAIWTEGLLRRKWKSRVPACGNAEGHSEHLRKACRI